MKTIKRTMTVIAVGTLVISQAACASLVGESLFTNDDEGRFLLSSDAEGLRAFGDTLNGLVTEGKASPDIEGAYWKSRNENNRGLRLKFLKPIAQKGEK